MNYIEGFGLNLLLHLSNYNLFDISMKPLKEHMFNKCKSQLKVIGSGFHKNIN